LYGDDRRHHIPKVAFKVQNWPEYEAGLRRRGSLTLCIENAAPDRWQTFGPGGQARYKDAAIQTTLMVRTAFKLAVVLPKTTGKVLVHEVAAIYCRNFRAPDSGYCGNIRNHETWDPAVGRHRRTPRPRDNFADLPGAAAQRR
jgi:hypothetical protein